MVFYDSPNRWFLKFTSASKRLGGKPSALDECVYRFYDPHTAEVLVGGIGAAHRNSVDYQEVEKAMVSSVEV